VSANDEVYMREGPWLDDEGRPCLGVWCDEGDYILVIRREVNGGMSFHICAGAGPGRQTAATLSTFRLERIAKFLMQDRASQAATS